MEERTSKCCNVIIFINNLHIQPKQYDKERVLLGMVNINFFEVKLLNFGK